MVNIEEARRQVEELREEVKSLKMDYHEIREIETIINRTLTAIERSTGSREIREAVNRLQRFISTVRMAQATWHAFQLATGPIGWAMFATGVIATAAYTFSYEVDTH